MTLEELDEKWGDAPLFRDYMTKEDQREYAADAFACFEAEGFAKKFWSPYNQSHIGEEFKVIGRMTENDCDLSVLPMWDIEFKDGTGVGAYPEEIIPSQMRANGCTSEEILGTLKECPHCGGEAEFVSKANYSSHTFWRVVCSQCGCGTWCDEDGFGHEDDPGKEQATKEWNQRT